MGNLGFQELILLFLLLTLLICSIFYLLSLQKALESVSPQNRKMKPGNVWLLFIPLFNIFWNFTVVDAIASSFQKEYEKLGVIKGSKPTYNIGIAMAVLQVVSLIPMINAITFIPSLVCWIIYWVRVNKCRNELSEIFQHHSLSEQPTIF